MIVVMEPGATPEQISRVTERVESLGLRVIVNDGEFQSVLAVIGDEKLIPSTDFLEELSGVASVKRVQVPFRLVSRHFSPQSSVVEVAPGVTVGNTSSLMIMAGPCSVETEEGIIKTAIAAKAAGANVLRGGAFKPRTAPRTFEGLGQLGLQFLGQAKAETGLPIVTEIMDIRNIDIIAEVTDIFQVGARNMQNFSMLDELGRQDKPVLLKRGMSATIEEWLLAAERIFDGGNNKVILCERGIRSFDSKYTRNILDLSAIPVVQKLSHLPIIADPSHGTGKRDLVRSMALAAVAAGADGLMIEIHPDPENALSDGPQSLTFAQFSTLMDEIRTMETLARKLYKRDRA